MQDIDLFFDRPNPDSQATHQLDFSSLYSLPSIGTTRGGDLGGPILNGSKTKIMGIIGGSRPLNVDAYGVVRGWTNVWIPAMEITIVRNTAAPLDNIGCNLTSPHKFTRVAQGWSMWERGDEFRSYFP
jgi:hypothetical protein